MYLEQPKSYYRYHRRKNPWACTKCKTMASTEQIHDFDKLDPIRILYPAVICMQCFEIWTVGYSGVRHRFLTELQCAHLVWALNSEQYYTKAKKKGKASHPFYPGWLIPWPTANALKERQLIKMAQMCETQAQWQLTCLGELVAEILTRYWYRAAKEVKANA